MKKYFIILILSFFALLPFNAKAAAISDDNLASVSLDNYAIPTWWSVAKNTDKALTIKYGVINPEYSYVVLDICSNGPVKDFYISNASKINSWFDESNIVILSTNETCKTHNGYSGTIKRVQLQVGKFTTNEEFGMMEVTSTLHLVNTFDYAVEYSFTGLSVFKEDYLTQIVNNQKVNNKLDDINDSLTDSSIDTTTSNEFFDNFNDEDHGGISGVITAPLRMIRKATGTCEGLNLDVLGADVTIPCGGELFWDKPEVANFRIAWNTLVGGGVLYLLVKKLFQVIENLKDPGNSKVEVMDL